MIRREQWKQLDYITTLLDLVDGAAPSERFPDRKFDFITPADYVLVHSLILP
jgi:hypothetical protein